MVTILLLSVGTNACYHIAKILKEKYVDSFHIIGADINDSYLIPTKQYIDKFYKVPYTNDPKYYDTIINICREEGVEYLLPSFDADQKLFYPENQDLQKLGVISFGTSIETLDVYADKVKMYDFLLEQGFLLPKRYELNNIDDCEEYFIKPIDGVASVGARRLWGREIKDLEDYPNYIIQEVCSEPEYTLECFYYHGLLSTICRERIAAKAGVCVKTRVFKNNELEKIAQEFVNKVKTPYCFNLQFMKSKQNQYVITDVNLRAAGGMSLSYAAGWDETSALAKIMLNKSIKEIFETLPENILSQYVIRAYTDIVTKIEKPVVAFDFDGTLLDSRKRHQVVMDDVLKEYDMELDTSDLIEFKSYGKNNVDYLISKGVDEIFAKEIQKKWIEYIEKEEYLNIDELYSNAIHILNHYAQDNDLVLITARNNEKGLYNQIDKFDLRKYFRGIYVVNSCKNVSAYKAQILNKENASKFLGDTLSDKIAADIAKVEFEHFDCGFHNKEVIGEYNGKNFNSFS